MSRTFAYVRVSTVGQTVENQLEEIRAAGFAVEDRRVMAETISGSIQMEKRPGFVRLLDRLERDDVLIVTKLDRLGRDALDVSATIQRLAEIGVRVHCLALGGVDLNSAAGRMMMHVVNAMAQFERDLIVERTQAGLARARAAGRVLGAKRKLSDRQAQSVVADLAAGASISSLARKYGVSRQTISRVVERGKERQG